MHPARLSEDDLLAQCTLGRARTGGPGGQHRNKVETAVIITHGQTGMIGKAGERRSVRENRPVAIRRLRLILATDVRTAVPDGDVRSELWRSRCRGGKIACNPKHRDYPALLAEAMDVVWVCGFDPKPASARLGCTASQLIKLVKEHPPAFGKWNGARAERGDHTLH